MDKLFTAVIVFVAAFAGTKAAQSTPPIPSMAPKKYYVKRVTDAGNGTTITEYFSDGNQWGAIDTAGQYTLAQANNIVGFMLINEPNYTYQTELVQQQQAAVQGYYY